MKTKNSKKKNECKNLKIIIIILSLCVVLLSTYILYDKLVKDNTTKNPEYYYECDGCGNGPVAPVADINPIGIIEYKLGITVPVLYEKVDNYVVYNDEQPYYAAISFDNNSSLEIAKDFEQLSIPKKEYLSVGKQTIGSLELTVYSDYNVNNSKAAVWKYKDIYYAFELSEESELNFDDCVKELISQVIKHY